MKLSEFILLSEGEKAKTVMCEGVLVAKKKADPTLRFLFQMDSYYVEMYCNRRWGGPKALPPKRLLGFP